jgi:hypothetical protein
MAGLYESKHDLGLSIVGFLSLAVPSVCNEYQM